MKYLHEHEDFKYFIIEAITSDLGVNIMKIYKLNKILKDTICGLLPSLV